YLYSKGDFNGLNNELESLDWRDKLTYSDINENWIAFKEEYNTLVNKYIPAKTVKRNKLNTLPWCRYKSVSKAKEKRRKLWIKYRKSKLNADKYIFENSKNELDSVLQKAKHHYENKLTEDLKTNPKRFWNYTRHFTKSSSSIETLEQKGSLITNDQEKAELLNNFFQSVMTTEPDISFTLPSSTKKLNEILLDFEFTEIDISKKL
ncbi:MAG: hypothetical protein ABFS35_23425, partial [Bacteroidota bacterium]